MSLAIAHPEELDPDLQGAVLRLSAAVEERDGAPPLSDQALTQLASSRVSHLVARTEGQLVGYAQLNRGTLEIVGDHSSLSALLDDALAIDPDVAVWSHGRRSPLGPVLSAHGFEKVRVLHQLRRTRAESEPEPDVELADGVIVRDFVVGQDEQAWVRVNAAAFASHPEQGTWTVDDLRAREAEPWFDPAGFLIAERAGHVIGFHWTKLHPDGTGEVYVLGVDPTAQGVKLGAALLARGLRRLADHGASTVLLYVDDDNPSALRLYERFGFQRFDVDVQWRRAAA